MNERYLFMTYYNNKKRVFSSAQKPYHRGGSNSGQRSQRGPKKQYINPAMFVNKNTKEQEQAVYEPTHLFTDFGFTDALQRNIDYVSPSAIQDQTIPLAMTGKDVIGLANTGTGKTAAFLLPILNRLFETRLTGSVLIIAPTRELAQQIDAEFRKFSDGMKLYSAVCVGGVNIGGQIRQIQRRPHVIIGTPGRLKDLMKQNILHFDNVDTFVLDEADRMLDMGFVTDIKEIASHLPTDRQTLCFSATMSDGIRKLASEFMRDPQMVSVKVSETNDHIYQDVIAYNDEEHKKDLLLAMLQQEGFEKVIVFGETKFGVQRLADKLEKDGVPSQAIHGNKSQGQRNRALQAFKTNHSKVLVATDVAARGLDIPNVSHVINFDLPQSYDDYVHRIGRTGRGGLRGTALTFVKNR
jgi:ATP-dependent RNA helicase RhlE